MDSRLRCRRKDKDEDVLSVVRAGLGGDRGGGNKLVGSRRPEIRRGRLAGTAPRLWRCCSVMSSWMCLFSD